MTRVSQADCAACVGLDWAEATHDLCVQAAGTARRAFLVLAHRPEAIDAWVRPLRARCNGQPLAVCLERNTGPMVAALRTYAVLGLFPVTPLTRAKSRDAFPPRRAKDDPTAAALQVALLLTHRDTRTPLMPHSPTRRPVAPRVAPRRRWGGDTVRLTQRLTRALKNSFPQVLQWCDEKETALLCDFLRRWPPRKAVQRARRSTRAGCFRAHHVRAAEVMDCRIQAITSAIAWTTDAGVITPHVLLGQALVAPRRVPLQASADCDTALAPLAQSPPAFPWCEAVPGAGAVCAPRLRVACGAQRERCPSAEARQKSAGSAPGTERRGKKSWGHGRLPGPQCLRHTCVEWAAASPRPACWAQVSYPQQRDQGKAHQAAVRALACTWLRILSRGWQERTP